MHDVGLARISGKSFALITGVDIIADKLDRTRPAEAQAVPTEDSTDDNVEREGDDGLACPDPERVEEWWRKNQSRFRLQDRYLLGRPIDAQCADQAWLNGFQSQRRAAAYEKAYLGGGGPLANWKAVAIHRQTPV
jgi:uncharacterized protein (TIGR02270 family)